MKIYTRTGDDGGTALFGGGRVSKAALRVEAYGTVDELNAVLGWAVTQVEDDTLRTRIELLQHDLGVLLGQGLERVGVVVSQPSLDRLFLHTGSVDEVSEGIQLVGCDHLDGNGLSPQ